jgi:hypothetical protein
MATVAGVRRDAGMWGAVAGDVVVLFAVTLAGFVSHASIDAVPRLLLTWGTAIVAWAWVAPWFGVFDPATLAEPRRAWRVAWAWSVAAPLAVFLRAVALDRDVSWVFVAVTLLVNGLVLVAWRVAYAWWRGRRDGFGWGTERP